MWFSSRRPIYTTRGLCCLLNALLWQRYQQCSQIDLLRTNKRSSSVNFEENSHDTNVFKQCWLIGLLKEKTDSAKRRSFTTILWTHRAQKTYLDNYVVSHTNACNWNIHGWSISNGSTVISITYPLHSQLKKSHHAYMTVGSGGFRAARLPGQATLAASAVSLWVEKSLVSPP